MRAASAECRKTSRRDPEEVKMEGWREQGILVVGLADKRLTWPLREMVKQIGNFLYGKTKCEGEENGK